MVYKVKPLGETQFLGLIFDSYLHGTAAACCRQQLGTAACCRQQLGCCQLQAAASWQQVAIGSKQQLGVCQLPAAHPKFANSPTREMRQFGIAVYWETKQNEMNFHRVEISPTKVSGFRVSGFRV